MVKVLKSWNLWNWRGLILGLAQAAIIGMVIWVSASFSAIAQGAKDGSKSMAEVQKLTYQVDSLKRCEQRQGNTNVKIETDIEWIKATLMRIESKLDKK